MLRFRGLQVPILLLSIIGALSPLTFASSPKIEKALLKTLETAERATIIIEVTGEGTPQVLGRISERSLEGRSRVQRAQVVVQALKASTQRDQKGVLDFLSLSNAERRATNRQQVVVEPLWITNKIVVKNADRQIVEELATRSDIRLVRKEIIVPLMQPIDVEQVEGGNVKEASPNWGYDYLHADKCGSTGEGVTVFSLDTGVRPTHEALASNYIGTDNGGWFDGVGSEGKPVDKNGHGTHTMGTICGKGKYGVAPGAKWGTARICSDTGCPELAILTASQWLCNRTRPDGSRCDLPDLVSNSWGGPNYGQNFLDDIIELWISLGIIPFFAAGNDGGQYGTCNTLGYPGCHPDVIGVGAYNSTGGLASFSGRGPPPGCVKKPDVVGPGVYITCPWHTSDTAYATISGTSMACPHIAGLAALVISKAKASGATTPYDVISMREKLITMVDRNNSIISNTNKCGGQDEFSYPNYHTGWGGPTCPKELS